MVELLERSKILKQRHNNLSLVLFGDFNIEREKFKDKFFSILEPLGYKIWLKLIKMNTPDI